MSYTLVVVDVQKQFIENANLIAEVGKEIKKAMSKKLPIIFVEFAGCGRTMYRIKKLTANYNKAFVVSKHNTGGGHEVIRTITRRKLQYKTLKVCGVYTNYCVHDTVTGLSNLLPKSKIKLLSKACRSTSFKHNDGENHKWDSLKDKGIDSMKKCPNVSILK